MTNDISRTGSVRSIASSHSAALPRPPPPPKPSHLSSAFTGTCNSIALRHYIKTHTTGGSFTDQPPSKGTISRAHLGHGYDASSVDHFVNAFNTSSEDEDDVDRSTSRPSARGRTYTAPSVSRLFNASSDDQDPGQGTVRLLRNEPIAINGEGPSRVGNLRTMFEAAVPSTSTPVALSKQNTGIKPQHTGAKAKPRISNQVRMLQAQITGDRFNGIAGAFNLADARSSIIIDKPFGAHGHSPNGTDQSEGTSIYQTATQGLLIDALKMDAVVIPPNSNSDTLEPSPSSSYPSLTDAFGTQALSKEPSTMDTDATISRSTSAKNGLTNSRILNVTSQHDRDDSSATIRPSNSNQDVAASSTFSRNATIAGTARRRSTRMTSGGKKGRLSSIFTASPQSSDRSRDADREGTAISPSPSDVSIASRSASEAESDAGTEKSREPSMLLADDDDISFSRSSHHLRANDGSFFDLDSRSNAGPTKAASLPKALRGNAAATGAAALADSVSGSNNLASSATVEEIEEEATIDANPRRNSGVSGDAVAIKASPSPLCPPSIVVNSKSGDSDRQKFESASTAVASAIAVGSALSPTTASTLDAPRPISARMPQPGIGKPARALYDFEGEAAFNELIIRAGQPFDIVNESLAGGWSLGIVWDEHGVPTRGLIPQGWYCYIQDFTRSPPASAGVEPPSTPDNLGQDIEVGRLKLPSPAVSSRRDQTKSARGSTLGVASPTRQMGSVGRAQSRVLPAGVQQSAGQAVEQARTPSHGSLDSQDPATSASTPWSEEPVELEPHTSISVSAFLNIGNQVAQWQQVEPSEAKAPTASIIDHEPVADVFSHATTTAIDGMPAASTEAYPIGWSAVAAAEPPTTADPLPVASNGAANSNPHSIESMPEAESTTTTTGLDWKGSIFGKKTFNRFASFVTSGAEDYVLASSDPSEDERSRSIARKVSGGKPATGALALTEVVEEDEAVHAAHTGAAFQDGVSQDAEDPTVDEDASAADPNHHFVVAGPAGPKWKSKCPPFLVQVHHPEKRTKLNGMQEYTVYYVTSTYPVDEPSNGGTGDDSDSLSGRTGCIPYDPLGGPYPPGAQVTVVRRFTQFEWLHQVLAKHYSALMIPPLPEKQYSGRFASDFIETRRADLEMWISRLVRHPVLRYSDLIRFFLSCEDEIEWRSTAATLLRGSDAEGKGGVFAQTWHPDFNFDITDAALEAERMDTFLKTLEKTINGVGGHNAGKHGVLAAYKNHREGHVATSSNYRDLSYTLLRTLTGAGAGPSSDNKAGFMLDDDAHKIHGPPMGNIGKRSSTGATNEHGAWCWREDCQECLNLTSALQNTAETLQSVGDIYEHHSRETLLRQHERFKELSRPHTAAQALLETHRTTLARYREATGEEDDSLTDEDATPKLKMSPQEAGTVASRCETVLNVTLAEMDRLHTERVQDYHALGRSLLDGEIELYEGILDQLKAARLHYEEEYYERGEGMHILPSRYQVELGRPKRPAAPLLMPSAAPGGVGLGKVGLLIAQATGGGGVIRPASMGGVGEEELGSVRLGERTNVPSAAEAGLRGMTGKHGHESRTSSYFSAIWR
ncbi:related to Sorting nexin 9 [Ustilago sp. UG-2017b]|nr:related to Sorting nexin 9 [Ustilago sp. UG-2017b]